MLEINQLGNKCKSRNYQDEILLGICRSVSLQPPPIILIASRVTISMRKMCLKIMAFSISLPILKLRKHLKNETKNNIQTRIGILKREYYLPNKNKIDIYKKKKLTTYGNIIRRGECTRPPTH